MFQRVKTSLTALALLACIFAGKADAGSLSTDLNVTIAPTLGLYCYDKVDVNLSEQSYLDGLGLSGSATMPSTTLNAEENSGRLVANANPDDLDQNSGLPNRYVNLDLRNVCAYYSFGGIGAAFVRVDALQTRLDSASGNSYIRVNRVQTRDHKTAGAWLPWYLIFSSDLTNGIGRGIDVRLRLDMKNAVEPGTYSSPTDGTFRITVYGAP